MTVFLCHKMRTRTTRCTQKGASNYLSKCVKCVCLFIFYHLFQRNDDKIPEHGSQHQKLSIPATTIHLNQFCYPVFWCIRAIGTFNWPLRWLQHGEFLAALKGRHTRCCLLFFSHLIFTPSWRRFLFWVIFFNWLGLKSWPNIEVYIRLRGLSYIDSEWYTNMYIVYVYCMYIYIYRHNIQTGIEVLKDKRFQ